MKHTAHHPRILMPGRNAWRAETADALAFLVDGEEYFRALDRTLRMARRSIRIVGWDFNPDIRLRPREGGETLGALLHLLVEESPELDVYILVWAMGPVYSGRSLKLFREQGWSSHPRIHLRFDTRHAFRGSHHQKMVTVDDATAFLGGIDLTAGRWDTKEHAASSADRVKPNGDPYGPVHDIQAMFCGPSARAVADLARWRWEKATDERLASVSPPAAAPWPPDIAPDMEGCTAGISRTIPGLPGLDERCEASDLTRDAIAASRRHIYIEAQYLASFSIADRLAERLSEPDGPEVVILVTSSSRGLIEQFVMAHNRDRLIRRLSRADRFDRLRIMYAVVPDVEGRESEVLIHSKLLVVDDALVRVGSSNLNNRSEGLDTECDIAVEARTPAERRAIAAFRNRLVAEHLDASVAEVADAVGRGSLVAAIEGLNRRRRGLRPFPVGHGATSPFPGTPLLDPRKPFRPFHALRELAAFAFSWLGRRAYSLARSNGTPRASGTKK